MSNLLEQASLVLIPSGYKEDVVYSEIPLDGSGDLQFTRSSNGTRINSAGLVEVCPWNLATYSEDFSAVYSYLNATISNNTTSAPNATTTADSLLETTATDIHAIFTDYTQQSGVQYTYSVYVKSISGRNVRVSGSSGFTGPIALVDLSNGSLLSGSTGASVESVGNGWYRISLTATTTTTTVRVIIYSMNGTTTTFAGSTSNGVYLWGAQLNIGSTAKPYFPTTDRLNVPRLTYQNGGGGCPSLLLEKQSTNLLSYSQDFTNVAWTKLGQGVGDTSVVTANYAISPDGTQNATRFVCNLNGGTTSSDRSWMIASFTAQATSTISIWIKLNSAGTKTVLLSDSGGGTKTISGTEWQRIDATFVGAGGEFRIGLIGGSTSDTLDCCIWGAQAESGTYPTSYIPTTSSSATRVGDNIANTFLQSGGFLGSATGAMFVSGSTYSLGNTICNFVLTAQDNTTKSFLFDTVGSAIRLRSWDASSNLQSLTSGTITNNYKLCVSWTSSSIKFFVNGSLIGTISQTTYPYSTISQESTSFSNNIWNELVFFPTALTDAEAISLTTL